jgi:hypothetical protein
MENYSLECNRTFAALGGPARILARLERADGVAVTDLGGPFAIKLPEVMKHLDVFDGAGPKDPGESRVEIGLRAVPEGTELTFTHSRLHDEESRCGHEAGWSGSLDKLERHFPVSKGDRHDHA